ncbi:MAG: hypothetical protein ABI183_20045 [Polyangiaceae bacterium]
MTKQKLDELQAVGLFTWLTDPKKNLVTAIHLDSVTIGRDPLLSYSPEHWLRELALASVREAGWNYVRILSGPASGLYLPKHSFEWGGVIDAALAATGDQRRLVAIKSKTRSDENPLFVLANPAQAAVIEETGIKNGFANEMPPKLDERARVVEIAQRLALKFPGITVSERAGKLVIAGAPQTIVDTVFTAHARRSERGY